MGSINIHEAKTHLSRFIDRAAAGEEIIIARAGKPVARLVPLASTDKPARALGLGRGRFHLPEDLDAGDDEVLREMFEGGR